MTWAVLAAKEVTDLKLSKIKNLKLFLFFLVKTWLLCLTISLTWATLHEVPKFHRHLGLKEVLLMPENEETYWQVGFRRQKDPTLSSPPPIQKNTADNKTSCQKTQTTLTNKQKPKPHKSPHIVDRSYCPLKFILKLLSENPPKSPSGIWWYFVMSWNDCWNF